MSQIRGIIPIAAIIAFVVASGAIGAGAVVYQEYIGPYLPETHRVFPENLEKNEANLETEISELFKNYFATSTKSK